MPRLPSSQDVPKLTPRSDPGVQAPIQAFESPIGIAAEAFAPAVERLAEVAKIQENRRDTVHAAGELNTTNEDLDAEIRKRNAERDLSDENEMADLGKFMSERINQSIERHRSQGASEDSIARLTIQLEGIKGQHTGRTAAISAKLGREKVFKTFNSQLTPLAARAAADPSLESVNESLTGLETQIGFLKGAIDPADEETFRRTGREHIALSAVDSLVARGRIEQASSLLDDGGLSSAMTPEMQRQVRQRIETVRFAREEGARKIASAEAALNRPLTGDEKLAALGIAPKAPLVSISQQGETARAQAEGTAIAKITTEQLPAVRKQIGQLTAMRSMLDKGTETGGFRRLQLTAANFFGTTPEALGNLAAFQAVSNSATLAKTSELKGAISERELDFVQDSIASAGTGTQANKAILGIQLKLLERERDVLRLQSNFHTARSTLAGFEEFLADWAEANPLFTQAEAQEIQQGIGTGDALQTPVIRDQAAYNALPQGATYKTTDGKTRVKGGGVQTPDDSETEVLEP